MESFFVALEHHRGAALALAVFLLLAIGVARRKW